MIKRLFLTTSLVAALAATVSAQNTNTSTTRTSSPGRRQATSTKTTAKPAQESVPAQSEQATTTRTRRATQTTRTAQSTAEAAQARAVREAFDSLVDGIRRADADAVMKLYWNSPQLVVFNNNGSVTKSWEQARSNRESLYAKIKDVKLDVRDLRVKTLGTSAALVTCLWDQSQTAEGQPEHATGRLSIVYQKIGVEWKIVHTHTSPDKPSPSNLLPSERTTEGDAAKPARPPSRD
ncbi:MAG: L-asparaginase / beta-aspartyl-peptidase [Acidobacteriota bacterium]|jgi:ketosteroid isomerase-like protein|nr:L-asparaginase / beta-aspartyl-peptidase [Acidobacteriota bacterium]